MSEPIAVLLVEDNPVSRRVSTFVLQKQGVRVDAAASGEEAVRLSGVRDYDLVLMDIELPGMSGLDAAREIRRREQGRGEAARGRGPVPIVAMTAHEGESAEGPCRQAGMSAFVRKPLKPEGLRAILEGVRAGGPCPPAEAPPQGPAEAEVPAARPGAVCTPRLPPAERAPERILRALAAAAAEGGRRAAEREAALRHLMTFSLGEEKYALDVCHLRNVMWAGRITPVPDLPPHVLGIINVRGEIISVVDLKRLLRLDAPPPRRASILITSRDGIDVGFLVDSLDEIVDIPAHAIDPPMITFEKECAEFIDGEARVKGRLLAILNYPGIMDSKQMRMAPDPWAEAERSPP